MGNASRDQNYVTTLIGVSSVDFITPITVYVDPVTHRLLVQSAGGGTGTVTSVSVTTANGVSGSVATATTTPAITLTLGAITPTSVNGLTISTTTGTLTITNGKTLTISNTLTLTGTDGSSVAFGTGGTVIYATSTVTLTNKRVTNRITALSANSATPAINTDNCDVVNITSQTAAITSFTTNLTGTPVDGDTLRISVTGTASVALTFGTSFEASTTALPTTTSGTTRLDIGFFWNSATSKWRCVATA